MSATFFSVTRPPSVNQLYANASKGRRKTERYRTWLQAAGWDVRQQRPAPVHGLVRVWYRFPMPTDNIKRDLGNGEKALSDLLVAHEIIDDDSLIYDLRLFYGECVDDKVVVEVSPWGKK